MMEFEPPLIGCVISDRDYTFEILSATGECVINLPTVELARKVVGCGNTSGRKVDKFKRFKLTALAADLVEAPLIAECHAHLECKVVNRALVRRYNFFVLQVVRAWGDARPRKLRTLHHRGEGEFVVPSRIISLPSPITSRLNL
jgi:flavin reductase (DIM6/NTAB) family NADH-FMN oxidoreductase RutF